MPEDNQRKILKRKITKVGGLKSTGLSSVVKDQNQEKPKQEKRKVIKKLSEDLNDELGGFAYYRDTSYLIPGLVVYVVEKVEPNKNTPWVTYRPEPRVIVNIHDNGVNNGTIFWTYSHQVVAAPNFDRDKTQVVSVEETIFSPLTKKHAEYICKLLNADSKYTYIKSKKRTSAEKSRQKSK